MAFCGENFEKTVETERAPSQINNEMLNINQIIIVETLHAAS